MDFLDELEAMAVAIDSNQHTTQGPEQDTIQRWSRLFGYTASEARLKIAVYRADFGKIIVPDTHWEMVQADKEVEGHDKESYEFSLMLGREKKLGSRKVTPSVSSKCLFKLGWPLKHVATLTKALNLAMAPPVLNGTDENGDPVLFCEVNCLQKIQIEAFVSNHYLHFLPTFIPVSRARKNLSCTSIYPTLGSDATMPHHRPTKSSEAVHPTQDEYPVWYFFYGTLADTEDLSRLLGTHGNYIPAKVRGGSLRTWGGNHLALIDGFDASVVHGAAFLVENQDQEDTLRLYETDKDEVVRCRIEMADETVDGLTSLFVSEAD